LASPSTTADIPRTVRRLRPTTWILLGLFAVVAAFAGWVGIDPAPLRRGLVVALSDDYALDAQEPMTPDGTAASVDIAVRLTPIAKGIEQPTDIQFPPGPGTLAIVLSKTGDARWLDVATGKHTLAFHIDVVTASEEGLLGLAFHPRFRENGRFYVNYVAGVKGRDISHVAEWTSPNPSDPRAAAPRPGRVLMTVFQPYANHDAGQLAFGPDGFLYVGWGDGGYADDPHDNGQNPRAMLGKMLRIDVDRADDGRPYAIPPDNPFVGRPDFLPEIFAYGLRNPWRYSFDPKGRLVVADVGQNTWEELHIVRAGDNLGWNIKEGFACFRKNREGCERKDLVDPVLAYGRELGGSITGGYVYLGKRVPTLSGLYVFGDFTSGRLFAAPLPDDRTQRVALKKLGQWPILPASFGRDADGELYVASLDRGEIYRIDAK
jgi:glucose/arabinose dehydrogenase